MAPLPFFRMPPPEEWVKPFNVYEEPPGPVVYPGPNDPMPSIEDITKIEEDLKMRKEFAHAMFEKTTVDLAMVDLIRRKVRKFNKKLDEYGLDRFGNKLENAKPGQSDKPDKPPAPVLTEAEREARDQARQARIQAALDVPRPVTIASRKMHPKGYNKNKRKRVGSDDDESYTPDRKGTPPSPSVAHPKHKHLQHAPSSTVVAKKPPREPLPNLNDESYWRLPERQSLVPPHPPPPEAPIPGPLHQQDVSIDLSDAKPPAAQITADTFWKSVEHWIRDLGEEDVAAMSYIDDDPEPFVRPPLGRHYLERWAEEEQGTYTPAGQRPDAKGMPFPPTAGYDPTDLADGDWLSEDKSLGPVAERLVSALQPKRSGTAAGGPEGEGKKEMIEAIAEELQVEDALTAGPLGDLRVSAEELDVRIKRQLKELGLWSEPEPDFSAPEDDSILAELRQCQKLLKDQMALNAARKYRLLKRCEDRLAYQDYVHQLERMDEQILSEWQKLSKKTTADAKKGNSSGHTRQPSTSSVSKTKPTGTNGISKARSQSVSQSPVDPRSTSAAPGEGQSKRPLVPPELLHVVRIRQRLVDELGTVFEQGERECPGRFWGLPEESLYKGISVEEGKNVLRRVNVGHPALM
ncbi:hypothetical protein DACRYDRAFT_113871 [Dacryopinax primogenitus]|uniref:Transcriptional adapter 3 n=1 Tax=Dacryopinax primogenitus (strain DJM 731) TaxID=1858805 RepID=M5GEZ1_DACPD|nr:uncharacterized protein DACRYDRAFT_113871 [Dacryopinax primogenitus]EJU05837.1 hypothetical protein DACRYDRAFT_113871 [Dacryopinax primogenitus]